MDQTLFDATAAAAIVAYLVSTFKPFVELLPFARVTATAHDATLQILQLLANLAAAVLLAAVAQTLTPQSLPAVLLQGLAQAGGSELLYRRLTRSGGSVGGTPGAQGALAPLTTLGPLAAAQPAPDPNATQVALVPVLSKSSGL